MGRGVVFLFCFEDPFKGDTTRGGVGEGASVCVGFLVSRGIWVEGCGWRVLVTGAQLGGG